MPSSSVPASTESAGEPAIRRASAPVFLVGSAGSRRRSFLRRRHTFGTTWRRFTQFLTNITITDWQRQDGEKKQAGVRACLNRHYWGIGSETANSMLIGSWGKDTRGRPSRDIDILFLLPGSVYWQYQNRVGNPQSQLLEKVKGVLRNTYSPTAMRADGQVICVPFN